MSWGRARESFLADLRIDTALVAARLAANWEAFSQSNKKQARKRVGVERMNRVVAR